MPRPPKRTAQDANALPHSAPPLPADATAVTGSTRQNGGAVPTAREHSATPAAFTTRNWNVSDSSTKDRFGQNPPMSENKLDPESEPSQSRACSCSPSHRLHQPRPGSEWFRFSKQAYALLTDYYYHFSLFCFGIPRSRQTRPFLHWIIAWLREGSEIFAYSFLSFLLFCIYPIPTFSRFLLPGYSGAGTGFGNNPGVTVRLLPFLRGVCWLGSFSPLRATVWQECVL